MNLHPLAVHFPIALLTAYSVLELVRFRIVTSQPYWFYVKALFVIFGSAGTLAALWTGDTAKALVRHDAALRPVLNMHENFAHITTVIFGLLAFFYLVAWIERSGIIRFDVESLLQKLWNLILWFKHVFIETWFTFLLAIAGLISVTITGSLGGYMVYGENVDPVVKIVYHLFFK